MTSAPFTATATAADAVSEGVSMPMESLHAQETGLVEVPAPTVREVAQASQLNPAALLARIQKYADTGKMDLEGLSVEESAAFHHILHRLQATFIKQIDCDEIKCDASRKCPKCGVSRVQYDKMPKSPTSPRSNAWKDVALPAPTSPVSPADVDMS